MYLVKNKKSPNYQIVYFENGKRTTVSTKTKYKKEAEVFLKIFKKSTKPNRQKVCVKPQQKSSSILLSQFKAEYLEYVSPIKSRHYVKSIELSFRQLENFLGNAPLTKIDVRTLDRFITSTFSRTERGSHLYYRTLKAAFSKAVAWDYLSENPFKKIKFPRVPKSYPVFISIEEFKIILSQTEEDLLKDIFTTALYTGMRLGELVNLRWNWIDKNFSTIQIKCTNDFNTKSKKERIIPINSTLKALLVSRSAKSASSSYIFTRIKGVKLNEDFVSKKFKKAVRGASLNDEIHFHTLRHSFASILVQKGVSLYVVKELLGHEDLTTTQIYSHLKTQNLFDAVGML